MNILFLNNGRFSPIESHTMYSDLMRQFRDNGHSVHIISGNERRLEKLPEYYEDNGVKCICVKIGNLTKCSLIEKLWTTLSMPKQYINGIKKYLSETKFDLVIFPTPPISLLGVVKYIKKRDGAKFYLLLKDIFPQNAVDIGIMQTTGIKGLGYKYFRKKEKELYKIADRVGCMSKANVNFVIKHNPEIDSEKVEICPNSVEVMDNSVDQKTRQELRKKYGIPQDKIVFVYGGNLGRPQGIPFIIDCLRSQVNQKDVFFLIVGAGTEYRKIEEFVEKEKPSNVKLMKRLPKEDYDKMVGACDIGMIFLDHRFTIPNFPSRLLSYMQAKLPVFAITDVNSDIKDALYEGNFGWWVESNNVDAFNEKVGVILHADLAATKEREYKYLKENYSVEHAYRTICNIIGEVAL